MSERKNVWGIKRTKLKGRLHKGRNSSVEEGSMGGANHSIKQQCG